MISSYISLTKPRICILVLVTTYLGYYIGLRSVGSFMLDYYEWITFIHLIIGTLLSCAGACSLNQAIEYKSDAIIRSGLFIEIFCLTYLKYLKYFVNLLFN